MRSALAFLGLLAIGAHAAPEVRKRHCLDEQHANRVAQNFQGLVAAYTPANADAVLASDFHDYSDSVETLINSGCPNGPVALGSATFSSRDQFKAGQGSQPNITFDILNVWYNCRTVTLRWRGPMPNPDAASAPSPQEQVTGIIVLETKFNSWSCPQPFLIETVYSEFNSGAWLYDLNVFKPTCPAATNATKREELPIRAASEE